jgi:hypothetical protein
MSSVHIEPSNLPDVAPSNHGRTVAAWVTNAGLALAALFAAIGVMIGLHVLTWIGIGLVVVSLATGAALRALGHGQALT